MLTCLNFETISMFQKKSGKWPLEEQQLTLKSLPEEGRGAKRSKSLVS